jgi:hypothetical protein
MQIVDHCVPSFRNETRYQSVELNNLPFEIVNP